MISFGASLAHLSIHVWSPDQVKSKMKRVASLKTDDLKQRTNLTQLLIFIQFF